MSNSLALACLWGLTANVLAMTPTKDHHWRKAYFLTAVGIPILGYITMQHGPWIGLLVMGMGCSILRWPVVYLGRWLRKWIGVQTRRKGKE